MFSFLILIEDYQIARLREHNDLLNTNVLTVLL